jgi:hypothetical protein
LIDAVEVLADSAHVAGDPPDREDEGDRNREAEESFEGEGEVHGLRLATLEELRVHQKVDEDQDEKNAPPDDDAGIARRRPLERMAAFRARDRFGGNGVSAGRALRHGHDGLPLIA